MTNSMTLLALAAIAYKDEEYIYPTPFGERIHRRKVGEALHPEIEPLEYLYEQEKLLGGPLFAAQYQQNPMPAKGNLIDQDWFQRFGPYDILNPERTIQSWDTASKPDDRNDYCACITFAIKGERIYILDVYRQKHELPALTRKVIEHARHFNASVVLIEEKGSGIGLLQQLKTNRFYDGHAFIPKGDKDSRFRGVTPMIEQHRVHLPDKAPWEEAFIRELSIFPNGRHDDQVDALSQGLHWIREHGQRDGLHIWMEQEAEAARAFRENRDVHLQAPVGVSHAGMKDGQMVPVGPDGTIWVTGENAGPLLRSGFIRLND